MDSRPGRPIDSLYRVWWNGRVHRAPSDHHRQNTRQALRRLRNLGIPSVLVVGISWAEVEAQLDGIIRDWPTVRIGARRIGLVVSRSFNNLQRGVLTGGFDSTRSHRGNGRLARGNLSGELCGPRGGGYARRPNSPR